jgi:HD-GYP domain-containing protein (c-di-GMP phosphodiesterase class II)
MADRPYRPGLPWDRVAAILRQEAGRGLCPESVAALEASHG